MQGQPPFPMSVGGAGFSSLRFTEEGGAVVAHPPFTCDGTWCNVGMQTNQRIALHGLDFFGPIEADSYYDVTLEIVRGSNNQVAYSSGLLMKRVFARRGQGFRFILDEPIIIHPSANSDDESLPRDPYTIRFGLKGPNTFSIQRKYKSISTMEEGGTQFLFCWLTNQLAELQFTRY